MCLEALCEPGDSDARLAPDYPLWTCRPCASRARAPCTTRVARARLRPTSPRSRAPLGAAHARDRRSSAQEQPDRAPMYPRDVIAGLGVARPGARVGRLLRRDLRSSALRRRQHGLPEMALGVRRGALPDGPAALSEVHRAMRHPQRLGRVDTATGRARSAITSTRLELLASLRLCPRRARAVGHRGGARRRDANRPRSSRRATDASAVSGARAR